MLHGLICKPTDTLRIGSDLISSLSEDFKAKVCHLDATLKKRHKKRPSSHPRELQVVPKKSTESYL